MIKYPLNFLSIQHMHFFITGHRQDIGWERKGQNGQTHGWEMKQIRERTEVEAKQRGGKEEDYWWGCVCPQVGCGFQVTCKGLDHQLWRAEGGGKGKSGMWRTIIGVRSPQLNKQNWKRMYGGNGGGEEVTDPYFKNFIINMWFLRFC